MSYRGNYNLDIKRTLAYKPRLICSALSKMDDPQMPVFVRGKQIPATTVCLRYFALLAAFLTVTLGAWADAPGIQRLQGISYGQVGENTALGTNPFLLDITFAHDEVRPLVVFVHGGGWRRGSRRVGRLLQNTLVGAGYALASVDYRLWPEVGVRESAIDVARAVQFLYDNAKNYNLDRDRIALAGHSAGAQIAALVLTQPAVPTESGLARETIQSAVLLDGHGFELESYLAERPKLVEIFGDDLPERYAVSPVFLLRNSPPAYLPDIVIAWGADREPTDTQSRLLLKALEDTTAKVSGLPYANKRHRAFVTDFRDPGSDLSQRVLAFLRASLR